MPHGIPDTRQFPWDQALSHNLQQLTNKVTGGINTWAVRPTVGVDGKPLGADHVGYTGINTTISAIERWDGTTWVTELDGTKVVSTPQLEVHVNQVSGNDNNDGRTASTAWKTISKFYQEVNKYNLGGRQVTLRLGAGTYSIIFPPSTWGGRILISGTSNASVTIQRLVVDRSTHLTIDNVTLAYPEFPTATSINHMVVQANSATVVVGRNVVLGAIGAYRAGAGTRHFGMYKDSQLQFYANAPVTLTGNVNFVVFLSDSEIYNYVYFDNTGGSSFSSMPNLAPSVNTGMPYTSQPALLTTDTTVVFNASGSITLERFLVAQSSAVIQGHPNWKVNITGSVVGSAYSLAGGSVLYGSVSRGSVPDNGIGFPSSISAGTIDTTSRITGTVSF